MGDDGLAGWLVACFLLSWISSCELLAGTVSVRSKCKRARGDGKDHVRKDEIILRTSKVLEKDSSI